MDSIYHHEDSKLHLLGSHAASYLSVNTKVVDVLGRKVQYLERGKGIPVVFLHGFSCNKSNWRGVMARFPDSEFRLIAPDLPGLCLAKFNPEVNFNSQFYLRWIDEFLNQLGIEKAFLLAHSVATMVAIPYASIRSDKLLGLVLANTPEVFMPVAAQQGGLIEDYFDSLDVKSAKDWYRSVCRLFFSKPMIPPVIREYNYSVFAKYLGSTRQFFEFLLRIQPQLLAKASKVSCDVLLITSDHDVAAPNGSHSEVHQCFPRAKSAHIKNSGHMSFLEKQTDFIGALFDYLMEYQEPCINGTAL